MELLSGWTQQDESAEALNSRQFCFAVAQGLEKEIW